MSIDYLFDDVVVQAIFAVIGLLLFALLVDCVYKFFMHRSDTKAAKQFIAVIEFDCIRSGGHYWVDSQIPREKHYCGNCGRVEGY